MGQALHIEFHMYWVFPYFAVMENALPGFAVAAHFTHKLLFFCTSRR